MRTSNQTRNSLLLALLATGVLAAGTLAAAPQDDDHMGHGMARMMEKVDTNKDGNISRAEHDAMRSTHLAEMDGNGDGFVTFGEHKAAMEARMAARFTQRHDENGDGRVSVDEIDAHHDGMFERMDADKDGIVTPEEMKAGHKGMRKGMRHGAAQDGAEDHSGH